MSKIRYESAFIFILLLCGIALIASFLWLVKIFPIIAFIVCPITLLISFFAFKSYDETKADDNTNLLAGLTLFICLACSGYIVFGNHKVNSEIAGLFVKGKVTQQYYTVDDENGGDHEESKYILKPDNSNNKVWVDASDYLINILAATVFVLNFSLYIKTKKQYQSAKFRIKYPRWKGDIPQDLLDKVK